MFQRIKELLAHAARAFVDAISAARVAIVAFALFLAAGYAMYKHPPSRTVARGELGIRLNRLTGAVEEWRDGSVVAFPGLHDIRIFSLRDQVYRPGGNGRARGARPVPSGGGVSGG